MTNISDLLLSKLSSISWCYSIICDINGMHTTILLKYIVEDDYYAVMVTDMTLTYFECLDGDRIDEHYRRFNRGEIKRSKLMAHIKSILTDIRKVDNWCFDTLHVDCHTSRLTLKVFKPISILKFEWSFYMISTPPETFKLHVTHPLIMLISSLRSGINDIAKQIKKKDIQLESIEANSSNAEPNSTLTDDNYLIDNISSSVSKCAQFGAQNNASLIHNLLNDELIFKLLSLIENPNKSNNESNCEPQTAQNKSDGSKRDVKDLSASQDEVTKRRDLELRFSEENQSTRTAKKSRIKL